MLGLGALLALEIVTTTPDALCPPLEEARAAVKARVGEVTGEYQAEFALIRATDGGQSLELSVSEHGALKLRRSLPLAGFGCEDAAQAIALVLERYFDGVENPTSRGEAEQSSISATTETPPVRVTKLAGTTPSAPLVELAVRERTWQLALGFAYDFELGFAPTLGLRYTPELLRVSSLWRFGLFADVGLFVKPVTERVREQELSASTAQLAFSAPLWVDLGRAGLGFGPWAQIRVQRGKAQRLDDEDPAYRALPGLGGTLQATWSLSRAWSLGGGLALGAQLTDASSSFVLRQSDGRTRPVLAPQAWFAQAGLGIALRL
jgi:hypothetical protein